MQFLLLLYFLILHYLPHMHIRLSLNPNNNVFYMGHNHHQQRTLSVQISQIFNLVSYNVHIAYIIGYIANDNKNKKTCKRTEIFSCNSPREYL